MFHFQTLLVCIDRHRKQGCFCQLVVQWFSLTSPPICFPLEQPISQNTSFRTSWQQNQNQQQIYICRPPMLWVPLYLQPTSFQPMDLGVEIPEHWHPAVVYIYTYMQDLAFRLFLTYLLLLLLFISRNLISNIYQKIGKVSHFICMFAFQGSQGRPGVPGPKVVWNCDINDYYRSVFSIIQLHITSSFADLFL